MRSRLILVTLLAVALALGWMLGADGARRAERSAEGAHSTRSHVADAPADSNPRARDLTASPGPQSGAQPEQGEDGTVEGIVRGPMGEPVVNAFIVPDASAPVNPAFYDDPAGVRTDDDGRFRVAWPEGKNRRRFSITHHEYLDRAEERARAEPLAFVLERGVTVSGRVVFPGGRPVPDWSVHASNPGPSGPVEKSLARTDEDGRFELTGLRPGQVAVWCSNGDENVMRTVEAPANGVAFEVTQSLLRVHLRRPDGTAPPVATLHLDAGTPIARLDGTRESPIRMPVAPGIDIELLASAPGCRPARRTIRSWSATPAVHDEYVRFEPAGSASVLLDVRDAAGQVPEEVVVDLLDTGFTERFKEVGDEGIRIGDLDAGLVRLRIYAKEQLFLWRDVEIRAAEGEPAMRRVDLPKGVPVTVNWPGGQNVALWPKGAKKFFEMWKLGDEFKSFRDVPAGNYVLKGWKDGKVVREMEISVDVNRENRFDWSEPE